MFLTFFVNLAFHGYSPAHVIAFQDRETGACVSKVGLISRKLIAVASTQVSRFYNNGASKMKWRDGYDCSNFTGAYCNSACKRITIGAIVTVLLCVAIGVLVQCCNIASSDAVFALERLVCP